VLENATLHIRDRKDKKKSAKKHTQLNTTQRKTTLNWPPLTTLGQETR